MNDPIMPNDLENDMRYTNAGRQGDGFPCYVRLDYIDATKPTPEPAHWTHDWQITGTDWDPACDRGEEKQLEAELKARYTEHLLGRIRGELHKTKTVLVREGGRLVRRPW